MTNALTLALSLREREYFFSFLSLRERMKVREKLR